MFWKNDLQLFVIVLPLNQCHIYMIILLENLFITMDIFLSSKTCKTSWKDFRVSVREKTLTFN